MKGKDAREVAIGALALLALAGALAASYGTGGGGRSLGGYVVSGTFTRIDGLEPGDPVLLAGIPVGAVEDTSLDVDFRAVVRFRLKSDALLPKDTAAAIHTDGVFGPKFVLLDPGGSEDVLKDGDRFRYTQDSVIVSQLLNLIIERGSQARSEAAANSEPGGDPPAAGCDGGHAQ